MAYKLTAKFISEVERPGKYHDARGTGLLLIVGPKGRSKSFVQRVVVDGRRRDIGLGSVRWLSLTEARATALENWRVARRGGNPIVTRQAIPTFAEAAEAVIVSQRAGWRDNRSEAQWRASLRDYVFPRLGARRVDLITTGDVLAVLEPEWHTKAETMRRVRQRVGAILKWSVAMGFRADNPAGPELSAVLPRANGKKEHMRALPHGEVGAALASIRATDAHQATKLALEFAVLTAARSGEVRGATWNEIETATATWTLPAARTKTGVEHRIPLADRAVDILAEARELSAGDGLVFPSARGGEIVVQSFPLLLRDAGVNAHAHGFRSSFRDWCAEGGESREVAEAALAHAVGGTEGAYFRSDLFERRRRLMQAWADHAALDGAPADD